MCEECDRSWLPCQQHDPEAYSAAMEEIRAIDRARETQRGIRAAWALLEGRNAFAEHRADLDRWIWSEEAM